MHKETEAGIDVSKDVLDVAVRRDERQLETARFDNDGAGHKKLVRWLMRGGRAARVVLEATGTYSLDVALALHRTQGIAVMVANPRAIKQFTGALMQRSKTDLTAAVALRDFVIRMPFVAWQPPATHVLELRAIARRIASLVIERTRERNRLHALAATAEASAVVCNDIEVNVRHLDRRIELLTEQAVALIADHADLHEAFERLISVPGIAAHSAVQLLPELLALPSGMTVRQCVAHAGLDRMVEHASDGQERLLRLRVGGQRWWPSDCALHRAARASWALRGELRILLSGRSSLVEAGVASPRAVLHPV